MPLVDSHSHDFKNTSVRPCTRTEWPAAGGKCKSTNNKNTNAFWGGGATPRPGGEGPSNVNLVMSVCLVIIIIIVIIIINIIIIMRRSGIIPYLPRSQTGNKMKQKQREIIN